MVNSLHFTHTLTKFKLVWRRLCDAVLIRSSCNFERTLTAVCTPGVPPAGCPPRRGTRQIVEVGLGFATG